MVLSVAQGAQWEIVIVFIVVFSFLSSGMIADWVFATEFPNLSLSSLRLGWFTRPLAALILGCVAWGAGLIPAQWDGALAGTAVGLTLIMASVIAVSHYLILDLRSAKNFGSTIIAKIRR